MVLTQYAGWFVAGVVAIVLGAALIVGQPAALEQTRIQRDSYATQVAIQAHPAPTPTLRRLTP